MTLGSTGGELEMTRGEKGGRMVREGREDGERWEGWQMGERREE